ncbi:hypothetical protein PPTG_21875 [Phytophthora nicotianae INRA-310]|uniref:Uncharacterized protein n=1 Tax=Phytophthora nicotianae (strain INRA-310) TaxID=761204 RepID=W2QUF4_PHYN3|nr:hypothetical protein PPTG_21875 [Phytophthora nicotianae INRA-310]ETN16134.1 hypothetical protein PPTG_21875 [Phytophthora nicotianae INRA-310]
MKKMTEYQVEDAVCGVCEMLHAPDRVNIRPLGAELLKERLRIPVGADIPEFIVKGYDASRILGVESHHYIVKNTEGPVLGMLPRDLTNKTIPVREDEGVNNGTYCWKPIERSDFGIR